jgi:hypothetical protein
VITLKLDTLKGMDIRNKWRIIACGRCGDYTLLSRSSEPAHIRLDMTKKRKCCYDNRYWYATIERDNRFHFGGVSDDYPDIKIGCYFVVTEHIPSCEAPHFTPDCFVDTGPWTQRTW